MNTRTLLIALSLSAAASGTWAQNTPATAPANSTTSTSATASNLPVVEAEVRRVDASGGKISLKHGEIKNLDMPPMTMVFQVRDRALLNGLKAGDKVRFTADQINGAYTVISLEPAH